jgi:hypothetical protein
MRIYDDCYCHQFHDYKCKAIFLDIRGESMNFEGIEKPQENNPVAMAQLFEDLDILADILLASGEEDGARNVLLAAEHLRILGAATAAMSFE